MTRTVGQFRSDLEAYYKSLHTPECARGFGVGWKCKCKTEEKANG